MMVHATRNCLENHCPEYIAVTLLHCISTNLSPFRAFFFNFEKSQIMQGAMSGEEGGWSMFIIDFLTRDS
jgi:hypothetical protein